MNKEIDKLINELYELGLCNENILGSEVCDYMNEFKDILNNNLLLKSNKKGVCNDEKSI